MRKALGASVALALVLSTLVIGPASASGVDPTGWVYNPTTRHTYGVTGPMTWLDAEQLAVRLGGHLVTVNDQGEQDWLTDVFGNGWIGINDRDREGTWVWSSGTRVKYTAWNDGEPDDWKGYDPLGEDAALLNFDERGLPGWFSLSGRWLIGGIVEVPGRPKSLAGNTPVDGFHEGPLNDQAVGDDCAAVGWAFDYDSPSRDVTVRILAMRTDVTIVPVEVWRGPANRYRDDLEAAGLGDGTAEFWADLRPLIAYGVPYEIRAQGRDVQTGEWFTLNDSPRSVTCFPL